MRWPWRKDTPLRHNRLPHDEGEVAARRQIIWLATLLVAVSGIALAAALASLRANAIQAGEQLNESLVRVIEEQTSRTFQAADQRLQLAATRLQALDAAAELNEQSARAMLTEQLEGLPFLRAIWVLDGAGKLVYDSDTGNIGAQMADREYFRVYQADPATGFHISAPVRSRSTGNWLISASRPLRDAKGAVTGVIVAAVEPPYFDKLWRQIDLGPDGAVALFRRDGMLMMRSPMVDDAMGKNFSSVPLFSRQLPSSPQGTGPTRSAFDSRVRIVSYRTLSTYPELVVSMGRDYGAVLASWTRFAALSSLLWLAAVLVIVVLSAGLYRQVRQRERTELHFRRLAQAMPQIVFITDAAGKLTFVSDQWSQITGQPVGAALGRGWLDRVHPDDRQRAIDTVRRTLATGESLPSEHRLLGSDGQYRWQLSRAVPNRDAAGRIMSWYGTSTDIDDLKKAEADLKDKTELVRMAGRLSRLGGWALDLRTMQFHWSDEASEILALPPGSAPTLDSAISLCAPASRELATQVAQDCVANGTPFDVEVQMITATGEHIWVRSMGRAMRDDSGAIVRMQGGFQDITARVNAEQEVRAHMLTLQRAAEAAQAITQQRTLDSMVRQVAEQARTVIGAHHAEVTLAREGGGPSITARSLSDEHAARSAQARGGLAVPLAGRDGANIGFLRLYDKQVGDFNRHDEYVATELAQLASIGIENVNLLAQVTELNTGLEDRIARRTAELRLSNAELEAFSYSVSHDLRSPLGTVDGFTRLLQGELEDHKGDKVRHYLDRIRAGVNQMGQLIDGLLSLAHVSRVELRRDAVDLSSIATEILERLQSGEPKRGVAWSVEPALRANGDPRLIRSLLENLLGNAWKFSGRRETAEIRVGFLPEHDAYFVRDNGAGFDMAYADKLFGTFQRLHDAQDFPGTGVGLATVARVIARHGGRIWAHSVPDQGATFYFTLPPPDH
ncbi:MAG: PAS domain-containing protein [Pseudomonadota bacterium]